ncbi:MAG: AAA family ATPase, partial [Tannerella sp.]|nr:AAA family ATPase [Tannerella sp.]
MTYIKRISDNELRRKLDSSGAVLIRGAKACGKTESAKQLAGSILEMDQNEQVSVLMESAPQRLLTGKTPRLIDEWQVQPKIWNYVRHEIDNRKLTAQFILTGSANPEENVKMHSGAGRFTTLDMRTMSWQELGFSSGKISLQRLLEGAKVDVHDEPTDLDFIIEKIVMGGFPTLLGKNIR